MGCASSSLDNEEKVARCKKRKKLMKQAVDARNEFAKAQMCYLLALRNTGATLRQFAEVESIELNRASSYNQFRHYRITLPPPPLPPPPPPPPLPPPTPPPHLYLQPTVVSPLHRSVSSNFSSIPDNLTDHRNNSSNKPSSPPKHSTASTQNWNSQHDSDIEAQTPPPPPSGQLSGWDFWDPFSDSSPAHVSEPRRSRQISEDGLKKQQQQQEQVNVEEEQWDETQTEFEDEQEVENINNRFPDKSPAIETDDNSSMISWYSKSTDLAMVLSRKKKNLVEIVKELDEYFLKASAGGKEVSRILETAKGFLDHNFGDSKMNSYQSAKVFSALSWSWSSKSPLAGRDSMEYQNIDESGRRGSHCSTLEKLHARERRLYEEVRSCELAKINQNKKMALLRNRESKGKDEKKIEKTRIAVAILQSQVLAAHQAVDTTSASIVNMRENELYPQLIELSEGLMRMWRSMYECHQVQSHIVQQINQLNSLPSTEATSDYHRQATIQLETEVTAWYNSFCSLIKSQRKYVQALNGWIKLSLPQPENLIEGNLGCYGPITVLLEEWHQALDRLPEKAASEAIKSFITVIHAMVVQQTDEQKHRRKSERLAKELEKKLASLQSLEKKYTNSTLGRPTATDTAGSGLRNSLAEKKAKIDAFTRKVQDEKFKHADSIRITRAMTLNNLQTSLPNVFQAMMGFSSVCMLQFEDVHSLTKSFRF
ncbi:hypothetical protein SUGI_1119280 [Cryptomeria japonica]|uniref:protein ALTERED PHOSPHATE STARVATION RESPONSE 1 n=1 Tax=Cryptomeria japonica TaxID=3369 RepID=UPI002414CDC8|nr:protein ALTERED PHOSPHATE STARVATION RESPONSE 1 [Cryptomeria japonica]GLJ52593.1 hypothetical protein SUGI_1119280 [Cryptomeria japonica]